MTAESSSGSAPDKAVSDWLDGLAGRPGTGDSHAEGHEVRTALTVGSEFAAPVPDWAEIERRASVPLPADAFPGKATNHDRDAANDSGRWRIAAAASVLLVLGVGAAVWTTMPEPEPKLRGVATTERSAVVLRQVDDPTAESQALAGELRALGAAVQLQKSRDDQAVVMTIEVPDQSRDAVNGRLAAIEAAVNAAGRLEIRMERR